MSLTVWTQPSGTSLGTFQERVKFNTPLQLPVSGDSGVAYKIISGELPGGLRIEGNTIVGTPYEVSRSTEFSFCIRASKNNEIADRTFKMTIDGADAPIFITQEGYIDAGDHQQYYVMDSSFVDYQIQAFDEDTASGQHLSYFIASGDGELPPGLTLTEDGRIVGIVEPAISIRPEDGDGTYDNSYFDAVAYDFAVRSTNGFDSYLYDTVFFDYNLPALRPKKLNRNYEFRITITDGDSTVTRAFKIFVVGDDYFRADNTNWLDGSGLFTADVTYLRQPIWLTKADLGTYRANNYITVLLDVYDAGPIAYEIDDEANLPPGMSFDVASGEIFGRVPYQPAITETYSFTVTATRYGDKGDSASASRTFTIKVIGEIDSVITWNTPADLGNISANFISTLKVSATTTITDAVILYEVVSGNLPPGLTLDLDGEIVGKVRQFGDGINAGLTRFFEQPPNVPTKVFTTFDGGTTTVDRVYKFTVQARDLYGYSAITREFTVTIDTPNEITFSNIKTKPFLSLSQRSVWKDFISDTNVFTPSSIYRPNDTNFGVQSDLSMLIYAGIETREAGVYISAMGLNHKRKRFRFGTVKKAVAIDPITKESVYEVVYVEMVDPLEPNGKRLPNKLSNLGQATTKVTSDSSTSIWSRSLSDLIADAPTATRPEPNVTVDSRGYQISNTSANTYFPNSISNWRDNIKNWKDDNQNGILTERNYLPLWMRSIQPGTRQELGFTLAIPLCFCKVGTADDIILNIKNYTSTTGWDFKAIDYTADRYIIDSVDGNIGDKYLVFRNDRITV